MLTDVYKHHIIFSLKNDKERFTKIYELKYWNEDNLSGPGSNMDNAIPYLRYLQDFIDNRKIKTIVDLGCGNWELMKHIIIPNNVQYWGIDLVDKIIDDNIRKHAKSNIQFEKVNNVTDCKKYAGDLLIVKDVMQHWNFEAIHYFIKEILVNFKYAILVNDFREKTKNEQIEIGMYRTLDLEKEPFFVKLTVIGDYVSGNNAKRIYLYCNPEKK
jgi:SAM-dependent methyltransferase